MAMRGGSHALRMNGDWLCPRCGDLQFARNVQCRICGAGRPPFTDGGMQVYQDLGYGGHPVGYAMPSNGYDGSSGFDTMSSNGGVNGYAVNGCYPGPAYPGSLPYNGMASFQPFQGYMPNGKGPGRPLRGLRKGFDGKGGHQSYGGMGGKGLRSLTSSSSAAAQAGSEAPEGSHDAAPNGTAGEELNGEASTASIMHSAGNEEEDEEDASGAEEVVVESLECPHHLAGAVIGRHGSAIAQLRRETRCHIEIEASPGNGAPRVVTVCGPRAAAQDAVQRIRDVLNERLANADQNGEGHFGPGRVASDEDRQRTGKLIDSLEGRGVLRRSWLDERCMEVLMMLPFEVTGRVLHEAERVDLWKTRNVSAFLMMLVKTVQHTPDRRDGGGDRVPFRNNYNGPRGLPPYGMRNDNAYWGPPQGAHAYYGSPPSYMAVPWMQAGYAQAYPGYSNELQYDDIGYSPESYPPSPALGPAQMIVASPTSPLLGFSASPQLCFLDGSPQSAGVVAVPVSPNGMIEYSPMLGPVVLVPASPAQCPQGMTDTIFEPMPLPPNAFHKYADNGRDGTQTPEIGSDPGDCLHESLMNISTNIYNPDTMGHM